MAKGNWRSRVDALISEVSDESGGTHDPDRHQSILRKKLLISLCSATLLPVEQAARSHLDVSDAIEGVVDALIANSKKDGLDLDGELLDHLTDISAKLYAVEQTWASIHKILNDI